MSENTPSRRKVLGSIAASGTFALGVGTASADHGEKGGNSGGGGPPEGHGPGDDKGRDDAGTGPSRTTGGSGITIEPCSLSAGETIEIVSMDTGNTVKYYSGCSAAEEGTAPTRQIFQGYNISGAESCSLVYIYGKRPFTTTEDLGEPALYNVVEVTEACGEMPDSGADVYKFGLEPATEGGEGE